MLIDNAGNVWNSSLISSTTTPFATTKSNPKVFGRGRTPRYDIAKIEVRNFAALKIKSILRMGVDPDEDWTPEQWAKFAMARQRLADELPREPGRPDR